MIDFFQHVFVTGSFYHPRNVLVNTVPFLLCGKNGSGVGTHGGSLWSGGRLDTDTLTAAASQQ